MANPVQHLNLWRAIQQYGGLTMAEKSVLVALCCYGDENGQGAWPGFEKLMHDCCCSKRTLFAALKSLEEKKFITRSGYRQRRIVWNIDISIFAPKPAQARQYQNPKEPPVSNGQGDITSPPQNRIVAPRPEAQNGHKKEVPTQEKPKPVDKHYQLPPPVEGKSRYKQLLVWFGKQGESIWTSDKLAREYCGKEGI